MENDINPLNLDQYENIVLFTGAGMSAECGIPTYRGQGGIWHEYDWRQYACQRAFDADAEKVLAFHQLRRQKVLACKPHPGHAVLVDLENRKPGTTVITQNIDGMHQRAGNRHVLELHGSLWRLRCEKHGKREDMNPVYAATRCEQCGSWLRPDVTWFEDGLDQQVLDDAITALRRCDLLVVIGTSAVVYPAAGLPDYAARAGAHCILLNLEPPRDHPREGGSIYHQIHTGKASELLPRLFRLSPPE